MHRKTLIWVEFRTLEDSRIYVTSPDLPGLHIVGDDLPLLRRDIPTVIKDILYHGFNLIAEVEFAPPLDEILAALGGDFKPSERSPDVHKEAVVADIREAA